MQMKLLKWELRSTVRRFSLALLLYACLCVGLPWVLFACNRGAAALYTMFTFSLGMSAFEMVALVMLFQRYHTSVYGRQGYLLFMLPVGMGRVLGAKLLAAVLWMTAVSGMMMAGLFTAARIIRAGVPEATFPAVLFPPASLPLALLSTLVGMANILIVIYFSVTVSKLPFWRKGGAVVGILAFMGIYIGQTLLTLFSQGGLQGILREISRSSGSVIDFGAYYSWQALWPGLLLNTAIGAALFCATARLLGSRTELK